MNNGEEIDLKELVELKMGEEVLEELLNADSLSMNTEDPVRTTDGDCGTSLLVAEIISKGIVSDEVTENFVILARFVCCNCCDGN